jgi:hypothetical protein
MKQTIMKNIHIIPTDKPSRLLLSKRGHLQFLKDNASTNPNNHFEGIYQNIYITSDEEIKEGDYVINNLDKLIGKSIRELNSAEIKDREYSKIILTTDQDLINDGVQPIDNEFLEWFVKNPSCDFIKIINNETGNYREFDSAPNLLYKIIIPQEEPKQETHLTWWKSLSTWYLKTEMMKKYGYDSKLVTKDIDLHPDDIKYIWEKEFNSPKQETLEEAAMNNIPTAEEFINIGLDESGFEFYGDMKKIASKKLIQFAKLHVEAALKAVQAERMYSEKEVLDILDKFLTSMVKGEKTGLIEQWFEQHKKK